MIISEIIQWTQSFHITTLNTCTVLYQCNNQTNFREFLLPNTYHQRVIICPLKPFGFVFSNLKLLLSTKTTRTWCWDEQCDTADNLFATYFSNHVYLEHEKFIKCNYRHDTKFFCYLSLVEKQQQRAEKIKWNQVFPNSSHMHRFSRSWFE